MMDFSTRGNWERADSDFYQLFTSFVKGKVSHEVLNNCQLLYKCKTCDEVSSSIQHYVEHFEQCELPNDNLENGNASMENLRVTQMMAKDCEKREEKKDHVCPVCRKGFRKIYNLNRHYTALHSDIKLKCNLCDFQSHSITECRAHAIENHNKEYSVSLFGRAQRSLTELVRWTYKCKLCDYESTSGMDCRKHARTIHKRNTLSNKYFFTLFESSMETSNVEELNGEVSIISSPATAKDEYRVVLDLHEDKVNYKEIYCKLCRKKFRKTSILKRHLAVIHLGHKRFKCIHCEFTSNSKKDCKNHILDHLNVNCLTLFEFKKDFRRIQVITPGQPRTSKPSCPLCEKTFSDNSLLRQHLAVMHFDFERFHCKLCEFKSIKLTDCTEHAWTVHKIVCKTSIKYNKYFYDQLKCVGIPCATNANPALSARKDEQNEVINGNVNSSHIVGFLYEIFIKDSNYVVVLKDDFENIVNYEEMSCLKCNQKYADKFTLRKHLAVSHLGIARYKCKTCEFMASRYRELKEHLNDKHSIVCETKEVHRFVREVRVYTPEMNSFKRRTKKLLK